MAVGKSLKNHVTLSERSLRAKSLLPVVVETLRYRRATTAHFVQGDMSRMTAYHQAIFLKIIIDNYLILDINGNIYLSEFTLHFSISLLVRENHREEI